MAVVQTGLLCPFDLGIETIGCMLNAELADHPVYDGIELQWFDDDRHGTGMLAFLQRRSDRRVDYYVDPGLRLDRAAYVIGGGTGAWTPTRFERARLDVCGDGVVADVRFTDVDGRCIEVHVDDRAAGPRRGSELLAPVGSGIDAPASLMLVALHGFDLVRRAGAPPLIRIDGEPASVGTLPGRALHRRHLVKAAAPLTVATLCRTRSGPLLPMRADEDGVRLDADGRHLLGLHAAGGGGEATFDLSPPMPPLTDLVDGVATSGHWRVTIDGARITGGTWHAVRHGRRVELALSVTEPWRPPAGLPVFMRIVTRVLGVFRRWPTTYQWHAEVALDEVGGAQIESSWERTGTERGTTYRRATGS